LKGYKILLITTGGTISQTHDETGVAVIAQEESIPFREIIDNIIKDLNDKAATFPHVEIHEIEQLEIKNIFNKDSSNVVSNDWNILIKTIVTEFDNFDAFVITHGTNTLSYTSAALSFALKAVGKPIVLTGSQVSFGYPGSDAPMNLENSIRVAAYAKVKLYGVMVVFGSMIITGTRVRKTNEFSYDAFEAFNSSHTIARIGNTIRFEVPALEEHRKSFEHGKATTKITLEQGVKSDFRTECVVSLTEFPSMNPDILKVLVEQANIKGFILRSFGAGDPNVIDREKLSEGLNYVNLNNIFRYLIEKEIPIVITTQASNGKASMEINSPGKYAKDKLKAIPAHDMSIESMTIKLSWLLGQGCSYEEICKQMTRSIRGEITIQEDDIYG